MAALFVLLPGALAAGEVIDVDQLEALRERVGQTVTVRGVVLSSAISESGRHFLNFSDPFYEGFSIRIEKGDAPHVLGSDYKNGDLDGQTVVATGEVELYRDRPRMVVTREGQVSTEEE